MQMDDLIPSLEKLVKEKETADWLPASKEARGLLWSLLKDKNTTTTTTTITKASVMISYSWSNQSIAREIATTLRDMGFEVWLDLDNMNGDIMAAMAQAILQARAVFVLVAAGYIHSANCVRKICVFSSTHHPRN
jgi:hypothetical protein